jgi:DNA replication protein DnaC
MEQAKTARETRYARTMGNPATALDLRITSAHCDERIKRYLSKWPEMQQKNIGLLLWGDVGTGKTSSAAYVVEKLKEQKIPCLMTSLSKLANADFGANIGSLRVFDLLVLDDLGAERQNDYMLEKAHEIIDDRVNAKKPMILTTNLDMNELKSPKDLKYRRMYDRILSVCVPIRFQGVSHRAEQKEDILAEARRFLE